MMQPITLNHLPQPSTRAQSRNKPAQPDPIHPDASETHTQALAIDRSATQPETVPIHVILE